MCGGLGGLGGGGGECACERRKKQKCGAVLRGADLVFHLTRTVSLTPKPYTEPLTA